MDIRLVLAVALGGAAGSVLRYMIGLAAQARLNTLFPFSTLLINVTGSFVLAFVARYATDTSALSAEMTLLLTTGFCGGYTTFSAFSYETVRLLEEGAWVHAASYVVASVVLSLGGTVLGFTVARAVTSKG